MREKRYKEAFVMRVTVITVSMLTILLNGCGRSPDSVKATELSQSIVQQEEDIADTKEATVEEPQKAETAEALEEADETCSVTLLMAGDMLMHMPVNESGMTEDGTVNFDHLFVHTRTMIEAADVAIVNQEVILGGEELGISGYPTFNTYHEVGDALVNAGFDVVLHATNHSLDKGKRGVLSCIQFWEENYPEIAVLGIQDTAQEQEEIYVYEKNNIRIAILNYTYGTNGIPLPKDMPYAVNLMEEQKVSADIERAKEIADFVVVCPHWGTEYVLTQSKEQQLWTERFLEWGVDLVIGTHPHVIEPIEMLKNEAGDEMLVYYSLGNYVNATSSQNHDIGKRMLGALAQVTITREEDGEVRISEYNAEPIVTYISGDEKEIGVYPLRMFTDQMANESYTKKIDKAFSKTYCEEIWKEVIR